MPYTLFADSSTAVELLPCPFCGGYPRAQEQMVFHYIECSECGASTRLVGARHGDPREPEQLKTLAAESWNYRQAVL